MGDELHDETEGGKERLNRFLFQRLYCGGRIRPDDRRTEEKEAEDSFPLIEVVDIQDDDETEDGGEEPFFRLTFRVVSPEQKDVGRVGVDEDVDDCFSLKKD